MIHRRPRPSCQEVRNFTCGEEGQSDEVVFINSVHDLPINAASSNYRVKKPEMMQIPAHLLDSHLPKIHDFYQP